MLSGFQCRIQKLLSHDGRRASHRQQPRDKLQDEPADSNGVRVRITLA